ncbi:MAG: hypothetical protein H6833_07115 [Planctomycetes bacterium]|nr:hypothetical protein [Planctomycetota bacterium]
MKLCQIYSWTNYRDQAERAESFYRRAVAGLDDFPFSEPTLFALIRTCDGKTAVFLFVDRVELEGSQDHSMENRRALGAYFRKHECPEPQDREYAEWIPNLNLANVEENLSVGRCVIVQSRMRSRPAVAGRRSRIAGPGQSRSRVEQKPGVTCSPREGSSVRRASVGKRAHDREAGATWTFVTSCLTYGLFLGVPLLPIGWIGAATKLKNALGEQGWKEGWLFIVSAIVIALAGIRTAYLHSKRRSRGATVRSERASSRTRRSLAPSNGSSNEAHPVGDARFTNESISGGNKVVRAQALILLPPWARVSLAARCAERVLGIYERRERDGELEWPVMSSERARALVRQAKEAAETGRLVGGRLGWDRPGATFANAAVLSAAEAWVAAACTEEGDLGAAFDAAWLAICDGVLAGLGDGGIDVTVSVVGDLDVLLGAFADRERGAAPNVPRRIFRDPPVLDGNTYWPTTSGTSIDFYPDPRRRASADRSLERRAKRSEPRPETSRFDGERETAHGERSTDTDDPGSSGTSSLAPPKRVQKNPATDSGKRETGGARRASKSLPPNGWYLQLNPGQPKIGPLTLEEMKQRVQEQADRKEVRVRHKTRAHWESLSSWAKEVGIEFGTPSSVPRPSAFLNVLATHMMGRDEIYIVGRLEGHPISVGDSMRWNGSEGEREQGRVQALQVVRNVRREQEGMSSKLEREILRADSVHEVRPGQSIRVLVRGPRVRETLTVGVRVSVGPAV